jgi:hypothetical protein
LSLNVFVTSAPDKYLFLSIAMAVTGIVTVLKWDRILPDAQDYLNLGPLPVRPRTVLFANAIAIAIAVIVIAIDVNAVAMLLFPLIVCGAAEASAAVTVGFIAAHALCVVLASVFTFCAVFAILGSFAAILPRQAFQTVSPWLRGLSIVGFLMLLFSGFAAPSILRAATLAHSPLRWLPPVWFLGLYQNLQHHPISATLTALAPLAWKGLAASFVLMLTTYALSYRRQYASVLEGARKAPRKRVLNFLPGALDLFAARTSGFDRAGFRFVMRGLLRNESHRLCLAVSLGLGWLLALQSVSESLTLGRGDALPPTAFLAAPLIAAYLLLLGLRVAVELPAALSANWAFVTVVDTHENETSGIIRRVMLGFLTLFVLLPCLAISLWRMDWQTAALHTFYVLALSLLLMEILLAGYRKMPLGCAMPGFRDNLLMICLFHFLGFAAFTRLGAEIERWMFADPWRFWLVPAILGCAQLWYRHHLRTTLADGEREQGITFENLRTPAMERLNLSDE